MCFSTIEGGFSLVSLSIPSKAFFLLRSWFLPNLIKNSKRKMKNSLLSFYLNPKVLSESLCLLCKSLLKLSLNSERSMTCLLLSPSFIYFFSLSFLSIVLVVSFNSLGSFDSKKASTSSQKEGRLKITCIVEFK